MKIQTCCLFIFWGRGVGKASHPVTVLTIGGFTSAGLLTLEAGCTERGASTSRALSELLLFENDNVLDGLALDVLPGLSGSHGFAIG